MEYSRLLSAPTVYTAGVWRYVIYRAGDILPFMEDTFNKNPTEVNTIIIDHIECREYGSLSEILALPSEGKGFYDAGSVIYIRFEDYKPAWMFYSAKYGTMIGYTNNSPALMTVKNLERIFNRLYRPGLLSAPVVENSVDAFTYDRMNFNSAVIEFDNSQGSFDAVSELFGNEFNILVGRKGAPYQDYKLLTQYYIANIVAGLKTASFQLKDKRERLSSMIPNKRYTAEAYPLIDEKQIDKEMQEAYGHCLGVPGVCLEARQIYEDQKYPNEELEGQEYHDQYRFRFSSVITRVDRIQVKMGAGEIEGEANAEGEGEGEGETVKVKEKVEGWTTVYQRENSGETPDNWGAGWKSGLIPGDLSSGNLDKGIITLHYAAAKQGGKRESKMNEVRMDGIFINMTTPLDIIIDIMENYAGMYRSNGARIFPGLSRRTDGRTQYRCNSRTGPRSSLFPLHRSF